MEDLDIFSSKSTFERIVLPCSTSRKYVPQDMSLLDDKLSVTACSAAGTDYVNEYVEKEERELLESASYCNPVNKNRFDDVSHGTSVPMQDVQNEDLNKIYRTYDFSYRPKASLTITTIKDKIVSMIETNSVVVIQGPTGCGKTTQVPQFILDCCYKKKVHCNIIVTQPRRIAAMSIAKRVSQEREWPVGTLIGYQVGLINHTSPDTRLTYCTTGVLLHKLIHKKHMLDYTHIILDEVHERDQDMDFLLLVVRKLLRTNSRTVKIILMSATFQVDKFAKYFSSPVGNKLVPAPIIDVVKRNFFNIAVYYLCQLGSLGQIPEVSATDPGITKRMMEYCVHLVILLDDLDMKADDANYDPKTGYFDRHVILIFLPGIHEIEEMHNMLMQHERSKWDIVVLHSSITNEEQQRIFQKPPHGYRRIILSTNIAESSITVPDVKYVVDFCLTKQLVFDPRTNFHCLELIWASKTNCEQRAGRTGRVMDGRVYRLVPQQFYNTVLPQEGAPEILRAPLENVVLKTKLLDMGEPKAILALSLDPPDLSNLEKTILLLKESGALLNKGDEMQHLDGELTDLGRVMANLPLDIHVTKLIMLGHVFSVLSDAIIIAASLSVKDMFSNPFRQKGAAYNIKMVWADNSYSDCIAFMNVYKVWIEEKVNRRLNGDNVERNWALRNRIQIRVLREIKALVSEITKRLERLGVKESVGVNRVVWPDKEQSFVLKLAITGAFYPNYFVRRLPGGKVDEQAGIKLLAGLDPSNTVYLQGWPLRQPGMLYARRIEEAFKEHLKPYSGKIKVSFDCSTRVYVQFSKTETGGLKNKSSTGKISPFVYKAVKMRQCNNVLITVPILNEDTAMRRAEEMKLTRRPTYFTSEEDRKELALSVPTVKPQLPGLGESYIPLIIKHIIDPGHFWIHVKDVDIRRNEEKIKVALNAPNEQFEELSSPPEIGTIVVAPFKRNNCVSYLRAITESYARGSELVKVLFIDYGYRFDVHLRDLRQIKDNCPIANIPPLALECVLANVRPSVARNLNEQWSSEARELFMELIRKPGALFGHIYSVVNSVVSLDLIYKNDRDEQVNINQLFIDKGIAIPKEEDYFSRMNHELREKYADMSTDQCQYYENLQYDQGYTRNCYPEPPNESECHTTVQLRGPFSPLEMELAHLTIAGRDKRVNMITTSINSVLLDTNPEDPSDRLLVAASVSQNIQGNSLTLFNTTLMPHFPGLTSLITLIFTPCMELRRSAFGTHYIGALCGLGFDRETGRSIFPEHDMEVQFDVEISINDLQFVNRLRHWINIGMQVDPQLESNVNMEEVIICQKRIRDAFTELMAKSRKPQKPEMIEGFDRWDLYDESLFLQPGKGSLITNNIYKLHYALQLEEPNQLEEITEHLAELRALANDNPGPDKIDIHCKLCNVTSSNVLSLRCHLYSSEHRKREEDLESQL